ncbi:MAG TPA: enoyl-CoA hydratase/isomerase family protein [Spirochaetia bacterium]|nr:enoyl-CoA hydratase/isomerase family protein [Spirochaetia bacterium]
MANVEQYVDSGVAVITLNDGQNGNLLGPESLRELAAVVARSQSDADVRAVLLRSNGPSFCLGMDLGRAGDAASSAADASSAVAAYADLLSGIFSSRLPFLCLLQGDVKAGGVGLACACDIVIATPEATFEMAEVLFGIIPANVLPYLLALRVPVQKARYLAMTSRKLDAEEALRLNLVDELSPAADVEKRIRDILKRLLRSKPSAIAEVKAFTAEILGKQPREAGLIARQKLLDMLKDKAVAAGIKAYQEGELPSWSSQFRPTAPLARPGASKGVAP